LASPDSAFEAREQRILDAAAELIIRLGYDKTTMNDVADAVGVSRGAVYLHFKSKDKLFEALLYREVLQYAQAWLDHIEADPRGGTIGGIYRAVLHAISSRPLMQAMMRRDRYVVGNYLRKPDNLFAAMQSGSMWADTMRAMQAVGAVRKDVDADVMAAIMDMMSFGLVSITEFRDPGALPPFEALMEGMADMMDRVLTPEDGGNSEAGKEIVRRLAEASRAQFSPPRREREGDQVRREGDG
jgi:AcrR family transcriptional regulator